MRFARAAKEDPRLRKALESVVFVKIDRSDEANDPVVETFGFKGIPHFFLIRPDGTVRDRWLGYDDVAPWLSVFEASLADDTTLEEKFARFEKSPDAPGAVTLGRIRESERRPVEAVNFYEKAISLDPGLAQEHAVDVFSNQSRALDSGEFTLEDLRGSADRVFELRNPRPADLVLVASVLGNLARDREDWSIVTPYLKPAIDASAGEGGWVADAHKDLLVLQAMYVDGDVERGVDLKRATLSDGWEEDPQELNAFAWWCYENAVNLEEAESLARKGAELAQDGETRAMILDTVAEIRNALGDPSDAAAWIEKAQAADPGNDYYAKQKERFDDLASSVSSR